jgi:hypothetical protein
MASYTVAGLTVTPILNETFGAEVSGIDWDHVPLPDETIKTVSIPPFSTEAIANHTCNGA